MFITVDAKIEIPDGTPQDEWWSAMEGRMRDMWSLQPPEYVSLGTTRVGPLRTLDAKEIEAIRNMPTD